MHFQMTCILDHFNNFTSAAETHLPLFLFFSEIRNLSTKSGSDIDHTHFLFYSRANHLMSLHRNLETLGFV